MPQGLLEVQVVWWLTFFALLLWGFQPAVHHQHTLVSNTVFELHIYIYVFIYICDLVWHGSKAIPSSTAHGLSQTEPVACKVWLYCS